MIFRIFIFSLLMLSLLSSCSPSKPKGVFEDTPLGRKPDYSNLKDWAAHPDKKDFSDSIPTGIKDESFGQEVDVFFLHPTSYTINRGNKNWNADLDDEKINRKTDEGAILNQASAFNNVGRIFAPRYRQAHIESYFTKDKTSAKKAFEIAYQDVKESFEYYLAHHNQGRPIIIASHSQGMTHATRLLEEFFDGKTLQNRLVIAYLIGLPITKNHFKNIPICENPNQTGCYCSWRTYKEGSYPKERLNNRNILVTNPITWTLSSERISASQNGLSLLRKFRLKGASASAQVKDDVLWSKLSFPGSKFITFKNYHIGDINLFWESIRKNASNRVRCFWKR